MSPREDLLFILSLVGLSCWIKSAVAIDLKHPDARGTSLQFSPALFPCHRDNHATLLITYRVRIPPIGAGRSLVKEPGVNVEGLHPGFCHATLPQIPQGKPDSKYEIQSNAVLKH